MQSSFFDFTQLRGAQQVPIRPSLSLVAGMPGLNFWPLQQQNAKMVYLTLLLQQQEQQQRQLFFQQQQAREPSLANLVSSQVPLARQFLNNMENLIAGRVPTLNLDPQNLVALNTAKNLPLLKKDTITPKIEESESLGFSPINNKTLQMLQLAQKQDSNASTAPRDQDNVSDTETKVSVKLNCTGKSQDDESNLKVSKTPAKGKRTKKM